MAKIATDISQSQQLAKILPVESADMWYITTKPYKMQVDVGGFGHLVEGGSEHTHLSLTPLDRQGTVAIATYEETPAWSLGALTNLLPYPHIHKNYNGKWVCECKSADCTYLWEDNTLVDACVKMIVKLSECNLL